MPLDVGQKEPVTLSEAYEILEKRKKEGSELGYVQKLAYEHASKFKTLSAEKAKEMKSELMALDLTAATAAKIVDIMPINVEQLKQVLIIEKKPIEEERVSEIMKVVEKYRKGK